MHLHFNIWTSWGIARKRLFNSQTYGLSSRKLASWGSRKLATRTTASLRLNASCSCCLQPAKRLGIPRSKECFGYG